MTGRDEPHAAEYDSRRVTMSIRPRAAHCMKGEGILYLLLDLDRSCRKSRVERKRKGLLYLSVLVIKKSKSTEAS